jgi:hypothetical protein
MQPIKRLSRAQLEAMYPHRRTELTQPGTMEDWHAMTKYSRGDALVAALKSAALVERGGGWVKLQGLPPEAADLIQEAASGRPFGFDDLFAWARANPDEAERLGGALLGPRESQPAPSQWQYVINYKDQLFGPFDSNEAAVAYAELHGFRDCEFVDLIYPRAP